MATAIGRRKLAVISAQKMPSRDCGERWTGLARPAGGPAGSPLPHGRGSDVCYFRGSAQMEIQVFHDKKEQARAAANKAAEVIRETIPGRGQAYG